MDDVILALDEACANVIRHAFPDGDNGCFRLVAEISDDDIRLAVEDDGVGFDTGDIDLRVSARPVRAAADAAEAPVTADTDISDAEIDAMAAATSGRGLDIIRQVMTSVEVRSPTESGVGTRLIMTKRLREPV